VRAARAAADPGRARGGFDGLRDLADAAARDAAAHHRTLAVLTENVPVAGARGYAIGATPHAPARWQLPDGTTHTGAVPARGGMTAGETVDVWLDDAGALATPPTSTSDVVSTSIAIAALAWLGAAGVLALCWYGLHVAMERERRRMRGWAEEWARIEPQWHR
jgi:hypothetical protein